MYHIPLGVLHMLLATASFALMGVFVKLLANSAPLPLELFGRFFSNLLLCIPALCTNFSSLVKVHQPLKLIFRSLFGIVALTCTFYSFKYLSVVDAVLLNNTSALFVPLILFLTTRVKTSGKMLLGSFVGFIGVILALQPSQDLFKAPIWIGLASGVFAAAAWVMIRSSAKVSSPQQILFYYALLGSIVFGCFLPFEPLSTYSLRTWILLGGIALFGSLYQFFLTHSLASAPVRVMSSLKYTSLVFAAFFDWVIWNQTLSLINIIGICVILLGTLSSVYFGKYLHKKEKPESMP